MGGAPVAFWAACRSALRGFRSPGAPQAGGRACALRISGAIAQRRTPARIGRKRALSVRPERDLLPLKTGDCGCRKVLLLLAALYAQSPARLRKLFSVRRGKAIVKSMGAWYNINSMHKFELSARR